MEFQVPQFIQREIKIAGPLTFKQFLFIAGGGLCCFMLYLLLAQKSFFLFIMSSFVIVSTGLALAFVKVHGRPLPNVLAYMFLFSLSKKTYLWKRKAFTPKLIIPKRPKPKKIEPKPSSLKVSEKSQIQNLSTKLETGMR